MRSDEFSIICRDVETGKERFVQNLESMYTGRVVACNAGHLTVEAFGRRIGWNSEKCRPVKGNVNPLGPATNI